ncbi:MAG: RsmB/NOP family class I SAM-dependent RNA methyltransferase [Alphaproteobacteria bacterium]|jgi:16S rRNA (cytosine967-C5)-methyltransferase|nr:rRNA cytosine-C5-methylase [Rhodospirillaceae bacterium]MDP6404972.1 RsmB/NOP family class I SAM-dependent RNA methyltransferase [Alphaproteobacteria bacterium]MDP6621133.1 RsmB/NOP family class I SAM-dependent RNA methyltransferase [Alphaproteobacteria bacterium]
MRPGARTQAAIELLDAIAAEPDIGGRPADRVVAEWFRRRRYAGSKDRKAVSGQVYAVLRRRAELEWLLDQAGLDATPRCLVLGLTLREGLDAAELFDGSQYSPTPLSTEESAFCQAPPDAAAMPDWARVSFPAWLEPDLKAQFGDDLAAEMAALNQRAPLDMRVNTLKGDRQTALEALAAEDIVAVTGRWSPLSLRIENRERITHSRAFREGLVEVQDEGVQLIALLVAAQPRQQVVDFGAGAGGKTLALAAAMENTGQVYALDSDPRRLGRMKERLERAGTRNVQSRVVAPEAPPPEDLGEIADRVLLDAPCTGTGTWRRNPDLKWRLTPQGLAAEVERQRRLLGQAAALVKPGGRLIYATCSLLAAENREQSDWFGNTRTDFRPLGVAEVWQDVIGDPCPTSDSTLMLTPRRHGTDGVFVAIFERLTTM